MTDAAGGKVSVALLTNGSHFGCAVLDALQQGGMTPTVLLLPEFAPAGAPAGAPLFQSSEAIRALDAIRGNLPIWYAPRPQQAQCAERLRQSRIQFLLVACWPYRIGQDLIESASRAALNLHPSLLPAYRGADPIGEQLRHGDTQFGVSLHLLSEALDRGDIISRCPLRQTLRPDDRASIERAAAAQGARLFIEAVSEYDSGWQPIAQSQLIA